MRGDRKGGSKMYDRFDDKAKRTLTYAKNEVQRLGHEYIGTEHLLLGLLREDSGLACAVLHELSIDSNMLRADVEARMRPGSTSSGAPRTMFPFAPSARDAIERAVGEAKLSAKNCVGTHDLLLGLLRAAGGVAAKALNAAGVTLEQVREKIVELGKSDRAGEEGDGGAAPAE
jgi:ATP-dependent Clp protease ATP-binding subunit ClpC